MAPKAIISSTEHLSSIYGSPSLRLPLCKFADGPEQAVAFVVVIVCTRVWAEEIRSWQIQPLLVLA